MAGVSVKMGVTGVNDFKKGFQDAKAAVSNLNEQLKLNESQLKLTGNQEQYLKNKVDLLKTAIDKQKEAVKQAETALKSMESKGVDKSSKSYQEMQRQVYAASRKLIDLKTDLKNAEDGTVGMNDELKKVGDGVSWENVTNGLKTITDNLEKAGRAAVRVGKKLFSSFQNSTQWADDIKTRASSYGISVEELQKLDKLADLVDTDVDTIVTARDKLAKNGGKTEDLLGFAQEDMSDEDFFWRVGEALAAMGEGFDKSAIAQELFGKSWRELDPLFATGQKRYNELKDEQTYLSEEQVNALGDADDAIVKMQQEIEQMKNKFWSDNADKITELLQWLIDNKDAVVAALGAIATGFGALKIVEFAANLNKTIEGFRALGLLGAGNAAKGAVSAAGGAAGGGFLAKLGGALTKATPWAAGLYTLLKPSNTGNDDLVDKNGNLTEVGKYVLAEQQATSTVDPYTQWRKEMGQKYAGNFGVNTLLNKGTGRYDALQAYWDLFRSGDANMGIAQNDLANAFEKNGMSDANWDALAKLVELMNTYDRTLEDLPDEFFGLNSNDRYNPNEKNTLTSDDISRFDNLPEAMRSAVEQATIVVQVDGAALAGALAGHINDRLGDFFGLGLR